MCAISAGWTDLGTSEGACMQPYIFYDQAWV